MGVLLLSALLVGSVLRAPVFWKLPCVFGNSHLYEACEEYI